MKTQAPRSFSSPESARLFLSNVNLGSPPESPIIALIRHPMTSLFSVAMTPAAVTSVAAMSRGVASGAGASGSAPPPAPTSAPPASSTGGQSGSDSSAANTDPTTLSGEINLTNQVKQSFTVGNGIISFDQGITDARKSAAISSTLLAQLHANNLYPDRTRPDYAPNWYGAYFNTLTSIGWVVQGDATVKTFTGTDQGTVDQSVLTLASALIGANGAAAIKAVLDSLKSLADNGPVITIFKETSQSNRLAQFTVSLSSDDPNAGFSVNGLEFDLEAAITETQVLFFKWSSQKVTFNWRNLVLTVDDAVYGQIAADVTQKIIPFVQTYVKEISV